MYNFASIFLLFFIYSSIGFIIEVIGCFIPSKKIMKRGFLVGPYCPIYGFGSLIMLGLSYIYIGKPFEMFVVITLSACLLEYLASIIMEKLFNARWWDYSHQKFNLGGRISILTALLFGLLGLILVYIGNPLIMDILKSIPNNILIIIAIILFNLFMMDIMVSVVLKLKIKDNIVFVKKDMTKLMNDKVVDYLKENNWL